MRLARYMLHQETEEGTCATLQLIWLTSKPSSASHVVLKSLILYRSILLG